MSNKGLFNLAENVAPQAIQVKTEIRDITGNLIENIGDLKPSDPDFFYKSFKCDRETFLLLKTFSNHDESKYFAVTFIFLKREVSSATAAKRFLQGVYISHHVLMKLHEDRQQIASKRNIIISSPLLSRPLLAVTAPMPQDNG